MHTSNMHAAHTVRTKYAKNFTLTLAAAVAATFGPAACWTCPPALIMPADTADIRSTAQLGNLNVPEGHLHNTK